MEAILILLSSLHLLVYMLHVTVLELYAFVPTSPLLAPPIPISTEHDPY